MGPVLDKVMGESLSEKKGHFCRNMKCFCVVRSSGGRALLAVQFSSVHSVVSDSLQPHESQHARPPCLSPTPGVHSDSCPLSQ